MQTFSSASVALKIYCKNMNVLWITSVLILRFELVFGQTENSEDRIVQTGEYPFVTTLGIDSNHRKCLGSLISENWVLTTCSCGYPGEPLLVQHGAIQNQVPTAQLSVVSDVIKHPKTGGSIDYCMNMIRLRDPVKYDRFTKSVKLVQKGKQVPINSNAITIAWSPEEILLAYNSIIIERHFSQHFAVNTNLTVEFKKVGAPLVYDGYQIGLLVYDSNNILHYTDISLHLDWIYRTVTFYEFKEEYSFLKNVEPNCIATPDSNDVLDICCTYPFGYQLIDLCIEFM